MSGEGKGLMNHRYVPDWKIMQLGLAGRLGKRVPLDAFTFTGDTERPKPAAVLANLNAQPLVIWREKVTRIAFNARQTRCVSTQEWRETGIYFVPSTPHQLYCIVDGQAYEVETGAATRALITREHLAVLQ